MQNYVLGIDIGGTIIKGALFNSEGQLLETSSIGTQESQGKEKILGNLLSLVNSLQKKAKKVSAIGIGVAGILDAEKEVLLQSPNLKNLENAHIKNFLTEALRIPVYLENDANAAALGEKWAGAGKNIENFLCITLGTGIGGGLILRNELWSGENGKAGEFGHMIVAHRGVSCACGKNGCLEAYSSGEAISRMARKTLQSGVCSSLKNLSGGDFNNIDAEMVYHAARNGDTVAIEIYKQAAAYLAVGIANVNNLLDIHYVILGGGVSKAFDVFAPFLLEEIKKQVFIISRERIVVVPSALGSAAGIYGAGYLALQRAGLSEKNYVGTPHG
jgi:glucokinase